jgi:hypothetical protein
MIIPPFPHFPTKELDIITKFHKNLYAVNMPGVSLTHLVEPLLFCIAAIMYHPTDCYGATNPMNCKLVNSIVGDKLEIAPVAAHKPIKKWAVK